MQQTDAHITSSPLLSIWLHPRATIRRLLDSNPRRGVLVLAMFYGFARALAYGMDHLLGEEYGLPGLALLILVAVPLATVLLLYLAAWVTHMSASRLGGTGTRASVRAALAWSTIPQILSALLATVPSLILNGAAAFYSTNLRTDVLVDPVTGCAPLLCVASLLTPLLLLWSLVLSIVCVSEAMAISPSRAAASALLGAAAAAVPILFVALLVFLNTY